MITDVSATALIGNISRPTSLYLPNPRTAVAILDTSSYSPFPTFPGSHRGHDPYGLNAYLSPQAVSVWSYIDPAVAEVEVKPDRDTANPAGGPTLGRQKSITKHRSLSILRRPSPLGSQPPLSTEEEGQSLSPRLKKRSNSLDTVSRLSSVQPPNKALQDFSEKTPPKAPRSLGRKGLRHVLHLTRKNIFGLNNDHQRVSIIPAIPDAITITVAAIDETFPSTPMSSRSSSNYSAMSSASSTSSSEGIKTPSESLLDVGIAGAKLADALAEAGEKKSRGRGWRGWLGGNGGNRKFKVPEYEASEAVALQSDFSSTDSSISDLPSTAAPSLLTLSLSMDSPPARDSSLVCPSEVAYQHTWAADQLRRLSSRKISQIHQPSPHPLAMSLRRQYCNLPNEVAFSIPSGQKVFPTSVNSCKLPGSGLDPAQGGLWLSVAIKGIISKLDEGQQPPAGVLPRKDSTPTFHRRPRGMIDFIERPPFEERMLVYYADEMFSPISMARPGYGVWDIDYSKYIY